MRSKLAFVGVVLLVMASTSAAEKAAKVHYATNEGFLTEVGVIGPPQMVTPLDAAGATTQDNEERIIVVDLELFDSTALEVAGIGVRAFRLKHAAYLIEDPRTEEIETNSQRLELTFPNPVLFNMPLQIRKL